MRLHETVTMTRDYKHLIKLKRIHMERKRENEIFK